MVFFKMFKHFKLKLAPVGFTTHYEEILLEEFFRQKLGSEDSFKLINFVKVFLGENLTLLKKMLNSKINTNTFRLSLF